MRDNTIDEPPGGAKASSQTNLEINRQKSLKSIGGLPSFSNTNQLVKKLAPNTPVHCIRPHVIHTACKWFLESFPGNVMYSVKSNPHPVVLKHIYNAGVHVFDVASVAEITLIHDLFPAAKMFFMHPVKSREAIKKAYFEYHIRDFSIDSPEELQKILEVTNTARDLNLHVRLAISNSYSNHDLSGKFGIAGDGAVSLLKLARKVSNRLGICFHVGSQCMNPEAYADAIKLTRDLIDTAKVKIDSLDIGGGFPSIYPELTPPSLNSYMDKIYEAIKDNNFDKGIALWCEPGRAMVAESGSAIVRVELRKDNALYINDGIYGSLFDAGFPNLVFPTRLIPASGRSFKKTLPFKLYGPTCDSLDAMKGPFNLPANVMEGDWIEIGQLGAYGATLQTKFNGFYSEDFVEVWDNPIMSVYGFNRTSKKEAKQKELEKLSPALL